MLAEAISQNSLVTILVILAILCALAYLLRR